MKRARLFISCFLLSLMSAGFLVENCLSVLDSIELSRSGDFSSDMEGEDNNEEGKGKEIEEFVIHQSVENRVCGFTVFLSQLPECSVESCNYSNGFGARIDSPPDFA